MVHSELSTLESYYEFCAQTSWRAARLYTIFAELGQLPSICIPIVIARY